MIETGVYFGNIHSFYDLDLILSSVVVSPAVPKTVYVDIPGADGSLDLTEANGDVKYSDRDITFTLTMNPASDLSETAWEAKKTEVSNALNGKACRITLDKDPGYYWEGRCAVDEFLSNKRVRQFTISAIVRPYKMRIDQTKVLFPFKETDQKVILHNSRKSVCPQITCVGSPVTVTFKETVYNLSSGTHKYTDFRLSEGENEVTISGTTEPGQIMFVYQEGDL
jgi:hypothetical protein